MVSDSDRSAVATPEIQAAVDTWGRGILGAPKGLSGTITATQPRDEALHRVVTHVVRRDLQEQRAATTESEPSAPRIPAAAVDPFAETQDSLKYNTCHVVGCSGCSGSGSVWCPTCAGRKTLTCSGCGGAGRIRNPRTNRLNKCKVCKASGVTACGTCFGRGQVSCQVCRGSGRQWTWLVYVESARPRAVVVPETPVVVAHPQLLEPRSLGTSDLEDFVLESEAHADGALGLEDLSLAARAVVQQELAKVDARLERVVWQQYMRISVRRYDVAYEMAGTRGMLTLSGASLLGASTPEALRPIKRRSVLWAIAVLGFAVAGGILMASIKGEAAYFDRTNEIVTMLWLGAMVSSIPWVGGLLRAWRPLIRIHGFRPIEIAFAVLWALLLLAIPGVGAALSPEPSAVEDALAAGDIEQARLVFDGLAERRGPSGEISTLEDEVLLAEADASEGEERLAKLDAIVANAGARAQEAAALARADRLKRIRGYLEEGAVDQAITAIYRDFGASWQSDPEVAEERARAEEIRAEDCQDDICRLTPLRQARDARETPERVAAFAASHARLLDALSVERDVTELSAAERVHQSDELSEFADRVLRSDLRDDALSEAAKTAITWAADQRATVPIYSAELDTLEALFPNIHQSSDGVMMAVVDGALLYFVLDDSKVCRGLYAVGPTEHRELDGPAWPADRILSQTFGRPLNVTARDDTDDISSTWKVDKVAIVARWRNDVPVELRIGDAKP